MQDRFGVGYHMTIVKGDNCDATTVLGTVQKYIPRAQVPLYRLADFCRAPRLTPILD